MIKVEDKGLFIVVGPMTDDTSWNHRVCQAKDAGRGVRCYTAGAGRSVERIIADVQHQLGLKYTAEPLV